MNGPGEELLDSYEFRIWGQDRDPWEKEQTPRPCHGKAIFLDTNYVPQVAWGIWATMPNALFQLKFH